MPVARIFTVHPERTKALSKQLESQGYTVEVVRPEDTAPPADLEIDFEIWPEEHALTRAADLAQQLHADVAVAPGMELSRAEAAPPAIEVEPATFSPTQPLEPPQTSPTRAPELTTAPAAQIEMPAPEPVRQAEVPVPPPSTHDTSVPPAVWMAAAAPPHEELPTALAMEDAADIQSPSPAHLTSWTTKISSATKKAAQFLAAAWDSTRHLGREYKERVNLRMAEFKAERQRRLLELEKRKAAAQERANELQAARSAASARLQELLRERGGEPSPAPASQPAAAASMPVTPAQNGQPPSPRIALWRAQISSWLGRRHAPAVQAILTGVAAMAALFALGLAVASFRPRPALSNSLDHPYKGVTVQSGGVTVKPSPSPNHNTPRPGHALQKPSPRSTGAPVRQMKFGDDVTMQRLTPRSSRASAGGGGGGGGGEGNDVTVRQVQPPKPSPKSTPQAGLKHISDLDN